MPLSISCLIMQRNTLRHHAARMPSSGPRFLDSSVSAQTQRRECIDTCMHLARAPRRHAPQPHACMQGDFRYVSPAELTRIGDAAMKHAKLTDLLVAVPEAYRQGVLLYRGTRMFPGAAVWATMVAAGGELGDAMRSRRIAAVAGAGACRSLFVHAGLLPAMMKVRSATPVPCPSDLRTAARGRGRDEISASGRVC